MADIPSKTDATISTSDTAADGSTNSNQRLFGLMKQNVRALKAGDDVGSANDDGGGLLIARTRSLDETNQTPLHLPHHRQLRQKRFPHHSSKYDHYFMLDDDLCTDENTASTVLHSSFDASLLRGEKSLLKEDDEESNANIGDEMMALDQEYDLSGRKHDLMRPRNVKEDSCGHLSSSRSNGSININFGEATVPDTVQKTQGIKARRITNEVPYLPKTPGRPIPRHYPGATIENIKPIFHSPPPHSAVKRRRAASLQNPRPSPMRRILPSRTSVAITAGTPLTSSTSALVPGTNFGTHHLHQHATQGLIMTPLVSQAKISSSSSSPSNFNNYNTSTIPSPYSSQHFPARTPTCPVNTTTNSCATGIGAVGGVKKMPYYTGTTAGTTPLETTFESDSIETSSPARFRFTSFPASLPRINNPRTHERQCPDSVRKRMSFGAETERTKCVDDTNEGETAGNDGTGVNQSGEVNQSRDDEGTHNTSISSLSAEGGHHQHLLEAPSATSHLAARTVMKRGTFFLPTNESNDLYGEDQGHFGYSDDDEDHDGDIDGDKKRGRVGRTRLDFNVFVSPPHMSSGPNFHASNPLEGGTLLRPLDLNLELSRPYDQRRINSFPSSLSSTTQMNTSSSCEEIGASMTPSRLGDKSSRPSTPREVQLRFPLESECSPIQDVKDDPIHIVVDRNQDSSSASSSMLVGDKLVPPKSSFSVSGLSTCNSQTIARKEEGSTTSESTNTRQRRLRPMPDMSAFEGGTGSSRVDRSADDSTAGDSRVIPLTSRLLCPPTPQRTPAWANEGGPHAFFAHRHNSLIATKVLLSCPSQVLEGRSSLENSLLDDESKVRDASNGSQKATVIPPVQLEPATMEIEESNDPVDSESCSAVSDKVNTTHNRISAPPRLTRRLPSEQKSEAIITFADDFEVLSVLGSGSFADVYKVRFKKDGRKYAVKRNRRQFRGKRDRNMALAEVQSMQRLQNICAETHSTDAQDMVSERTSYSLYVLFFYRAWQEGGYFYNQTELCCRDTCREMLDSIRFLWSTARTRFPSLSRNLLLVGPGAPVSTKGVPGTDRLVPNLTVWKICHDISAGLSHIHSHNIAHGDLKPSNIFFVTHARFGAMCKIGDFGMAGSIGSVGDGQEGDARYMSSELLASATRRASCDIFSLGLTLYEIATDEHIEMPSEGPRWHQLRSVNQPHLPPCRSDELQKLVQAMTNPDETIRPTADEILKHRDVRVAGLGVDKFLQEYIIDVEDFDRREEDRLAMDQTEDQTPRNGHRSAVRRSPTLSTLLAPAPNLFSPTVINP